MFIFDYISLYLLAAMLETDICCYITLYLLAAMLENVYICLYYMVILHILPIFACCYARRCVYLRLLLCILRILGMLCCYIVHVC